MKKLLLKLKKGVSIVEVVIAIAVISIISVSAVTVVTLSIQNKEKSIINHDIANVCQVVLDCYRFDGDLSRLGTEYFYSNQYDSDQKTINRGKYILSITYNSGDNADTITLTAKDSEGKVLYTLENVK